LSPFNQQLKRQKQKTKNKNKKQKKTTTATTTTIITKKQTNKQNLVKSLDS